ncbi:MAG: LacI family DNA-binding transcriptional regulator [Spirochaetota bacterium]
MSRPPRRDDVARRAGVSTATVSRVYNRPGSVSEEKRRAVARAAKELGYQPNRAASALRRMSEGQVLVLELRHQARHYWTDSRSYSWFFADAVRSVMEALHGSLYYLTLDTWNVEEELAPIVRKHRPAGIICFDVETRDEAERVQAAGLPYVLCWHVEGLHGFNRVSSDNYHGGYLAGSALSDNGYGRPAYVIGPSFNPAVHEARRRGFADAFGELEVRTRDAGLGIDAGRRAGRELAPEIRAGRIDSVGVVNDITGLGVAQALLAAGLRIPDDVAMVGYDNMPINAALPFSLTTVDIEIGALFRRAAEALLEVLRGAETVQYTHRPVLLEGESVGSRS